MTQSKTVSSKTKTSAGALESAIAFLLTAPHNVLVIDVGNSMIKAYVNGHLVQLSTEYQLRLDGNIKPRLFKGHNILNEFTVQIYDNSAHMGRQYSFSNAMDGGERPADGDKIDVYLPIVLGLCATNTDSPWVVAISHWDDEEDKKVEGLLTGTHVCRVNGKDAQIDISETYFIPEGMGADFYARHNAELSGPIAIIDVGYNTVGFCLHSSAGTCVKRKYRENMGVRTIVQRIVDDESLEDTLGRVPTDKAVIDAIVAGGHIQTNARMSKTLDINPWIHAYGAQWLSKTMNKLDRTYGPELDTAQHYWVVGGGAHMLRPAVHETGVFIPESPELTNLHGMAIKTHQLLK